MYCEKCKGKVVDGVCIKCGKIKDGDKIEEKNIDKFEDLKLFNKDFDSINRNKKQYLPFIFGPIYISYRGHFFTGTILVLVDYLLFYFIVLNNILNIFSSVIMIYLYIFIDRLLWATFSNPICISLDKIKIKQIKNKYKENYKYELKVYKHRKIYSVLTVLIYIILILIFIKIKRIQNGVI